MTVDRRGLTLGSGRAGGFSVRRDTPETPPVGSGVCVFVTDFVLEPTLRLGASWLN